MFCIKYLRLIMYATFSSGIERVRDGMADKVAVLIEIFALVLMSAGKSLYYL